MKVTYEHTFTVTVYGEDNFSDEATMAKAVEYGDRDARNVQILVQRGLGKPHTVASQRKTATVIVTEES